MRYNKIRKMDISNGPGVRVSIFLQGCAFHCEGCFNPETWDFEAGEEFTEETVDEVMELCGKSHIKGLSILGGEPMHPSNIKATEMLAKRFKKMYPDKNLWGWSGYTFEDYLSKQDVIKYFDVIVDGQFDIKLRNPKLEWKGSENQRVIDVQKSLKNGKVEILE
ncbi:MAG: anaerobic ribonucleoside-triphosphate reductase activating protein [Clostridia bacterium]|nr:anaerobic ribonucleoside-triphosphate reductase activating protein [Clostridia bacterium]